jgi:septum formation protein
LGIPFDIVIPDVEELTDGPPEEVVVENARRKAAAGRQAGEDTLTLGVDTEVILAGRLLGKASDRTEARRRLEALSGRTHTVLSGVVLYGASPPDAEPAERSGVARSEVTFRELDETTLETYIASGQWRDRAGAYAIQGLGSILIERVEGDFSNVVGLPVTLLLALAPELLGPAGGSAPDPPNPNP